MDCAMSLRTETETVVKKILPYLNRRGYDTIKDLDFETAVKSTDRYSQGYVDILVTCGRTKPLFVIEAKRLTRKLTVEDRNQAIDYARSLDLPFAVVTNGIQIQSFNAVTGMAIRWNGCLSERIPTKSQLTAVIRAFKVNKKAYDVPLENDGGLPFRPGLPLRQLNGLFARCHNAIRRIEKDEEHAFTDFAKLLFLKLLEEKEDTSDFRLPYSYRFHELAKRPRTEADQVQAAVVDMIDRIKRRTAYGDVLEEGLYLKKPPTYLSIVEELSRVSFYDCSLDSKGAAFEYYVRATLKGKKLGQYFTPRALVRLMGALMGKDKILAAVRAGAEIKVLDPACGTGGFLVFLMQQNLRMLDELLRGRKITKATFDALAERIQRRVFFGSDANSGVACAAKMNMIIAGDGHTNIQWEDSLAKSPANWNPGAADCDMILTNPPFGTSESESLSAEEIAEYPIRSLKGQHLFLQRMVLCTKPGGEICTVIDEGVLNTDSAAELRRWLLQKCKIKAVVRLPEETFKPNKINVRASVLLLERWESDDDDLENDYLITFCDLRSLGYEGSGDLLRNFDFGRLIGEVETQWLGKQGSPREGYCWQAFDERVFEVVKEGTLRLDLKYWEPTVRARLVALRKVGAKSIKELNQIATERGISPAAENYVDEADGFALVVKAGSNISKFGELVQQGDFIEKALYDEYVEDAKTTERNGNLVIEGDVLLASTGDGTLGKCCVYTSKKPAVADGHVTIIRVDPKGIDRTYLCDYLRFGFGATQIERLYTGSTGLIELTPQDVDRILIDVRLDVDGQRKAATELRSKELSYCRAIEGAETELGKARDTFRGG